MRRAALVLAALALVAGCATGRPADTTTAVAELRNAAGQSVGTARLVQDGDVVAIVVEARGLPPGPHAVHIHSVGKCDPPDFVSAGGHFNPTSKQHGALNPQGHHAGDLPNLTIAADGTGRLTTSTEELELRPGPTSVFDADGSALVIHAGPDDFKTDPAGNAGARIACGVLARPAP